MPTPISLAAWVTSGDTAELAVHGSDKRDHGREGHEAA